jgi:Ca-activated chloride channel family protein
MTRSNRPPAPIIDLVAGLDRSLAWKDGNSVRYLVADLIARRDGNAFRETIPLNLALAVDVSSSMAGEKLAFARNTALSVVDALQPRDRLTLVAFSRDAVLLLDATAMDDAGRAAAATAIGGLHSGGNTDLSAGWLLAAEHLAIAMQAAPRASHRLLLLSDGQTNQGITDPSKLSRHAGALMARGIVTSAVGIGNGYDEALLGSMAEAGGGRLHDAEHAREISEVVLGELLEGRGAVLERARLCVTVPATMRAEVVGPWAHTVLGGTIEVLVGMLLPNRLRRVVLRLHCPAGAPGDVLLLGAAADGMLPDGSGQVEARPAEIEMHLARGSDNNAQPRDLDRSQAVVQAWHAAILRKAAGLNRAGDGRGGRHFLEREMQLIERYARGVPKVETMLAELVLLLRRVDQDWGERTRKEVFSASVQRGRYENDLREEVRAPLLERLWREIR